MKKLVVVALSLVIILGFLFWKFGPSFQQTPPTGPVSLTYWGLKDENIIKPQVVEFESQNPNIKINYVHQSTINYRTRVQTQIRSGVGPDIFQFHNSWLAMFESDLAPAPKDIWTMEEYKKDFLPIAADSFSKNDNIFAAPDQIDGLALFINEDILQAVGEKVPKNWREFIESAVKVTVQDETGKIQTAGAALGTTSNVDYWSDILGLLLMQQPGVNLASPQSPAVAEVLRFYISFVIDPRRKTWDVNMPSSSETFAQGRLAFYFGPAWRTGQFKQNPNLKFKVVPVPQLSERQVAWASFWGEAVSGTSKYQKQAWQFIKFLTAKEIEIRKQMAADSLLNAYISQGSYYKFWYLSSNTFDNGINDEMITVWKEGVDEILQTNNPDKALQNIAVGVRKVLDKYTKPVPAPTR
ncbi:extracellular solute-binding protein [Candidatus Daviesbacteria bacterium]|nr:extracellular solute-binding protein [Candidatus Daviesbacteria bacterium]